MLKLGFLASHGGSSMKAIVAAIQAGELNAEPAVVIGNNSRSVALAYASKQGLPCFHISSKTHGETEDETIRDTLVQFGVDVVVLSGYMKKLGPMTLGTFGGRILNIHPALLPKYGGQGMYGQHVHEAVIAAGEAETGITIHVVNDRYDQGPIVAQRTLPVLPGETPAELGERIKQYEGPFYVQVLGDLVAGRLALPHE